MRPLLALLIAILVTSCGESQDAEMNADRFWSLIDEIHAETGFDMEKKEALLTKRLRELSVDQLRAYSDLWEAAMDRAYDWRLWAAAHVIHGGCADDGFSDFRSTIIMLGRATFEAALRDPESLLDAAKAAKGDLRHENFGYPVNRVWKEKTGEDYPERSAPAPTEPSGERWEDEDLPRVVPRLWAQFGEAQGGD